MCPADSIYTNYFGHLKMTIFRIKFKILKQVKKLTRELIPTGLVIFSRSMDEQLFANGG